MSEATLLQLTTADGHLVLNAMQVALAAVADAAVMETLAASAVVALVATAPSWTWWRVPWQVGACTSPSAVHLHTTCSTCSIASTQELTAVQNLLRVQLQQLQVCWAHSLRALQVCP